MMTARAGGSGEILRHEVTGVLYESTDVDGLAGAVRRMFDPGLRERLSAAARDDLAPYSPPSVAGQLRQLYERVAARSRGR